MRFARRHALRMALALGLGAGLCGLAPSVGHAGDGAYFVTDFRGLALKGYDAVAYFTTGAAEKGSASYELQWRGAAWRFTSERNMALFARAPEHYAPAYGGHCALGVAFGKRHNGDPTRWDVVEGRLFVKESATAQAMWRRDPQRYIRDADAEWDAMADQSL